MPKVLTDPQVRSFQEDGFLTPVRAISAARARELRARFESVEALRRRHQEDEHRELEARRRVARQADLRRQPDRPGRRVRGRPPGYVSPNTRAALP
jgi:hypothetical protein